MSAKAPTDPPSPEKPGSQWKWLWLAVKAAVTAGLIWLAVRDVSLDGISQVMKQADVGLLVLAALALVGTSLVASVRWQAVSAAAHAPVSQVQALHFLIVGVFFNQTLPTTIGGDAFRIWLLRATGARMRDSVASVLLDRAIGTAALALTAVVGVPWLLATAAHEGVAWTLVALGAGAIAGIILLLVMGRRSNEAPGASLAARAADLLRRPGQAFWRIVRAPTSLAWITFLSFAIHLLLVSSAWLFLEAVSTPVGFGPLLALVPGVFLLTVLPVSLGGWGVREATMVAALTPLGVPAAAALALSVSIGLVQFLSGLPGGLLWLRRT